MKEGYIARAALVHDVIASIGSPDQREIGLAGMGTALGAA
jgi:hypothetical protein